MKKNVLAPTFTLTLLILALVDVQFVNLAVANFHIPATPVIEMQSPTSFVNVHDVPLVIRAKVPAIGSGAGFEGIKWLNYSLDSQASVPITLESQGQVAGNITDPENPFNGDPYYLYIGRGTLTGISDGQHYLIIDGESNFNKSLRVTASFTVDTVRPSIAVLSPLSTHTYTSTSVKLEYVVAEPVSWAGYSLDQGANVTSRINTTLTSLSYGVHVLKVYANDSAGNLCSSDSIVFTVKDIVPPSISILSVENKTYNTPDIPLNFAIDTPVSWIGYSLDNQANVTVAGNTTLTELSHGSHNLTVYANDTAGNVGASEITAFNVNKEQEGELEPFPTTLVVATAAASVSVAGIGLFVSIRKRKH
jgi:hypothetical protein